MSSSDERHRFLDYLMRSALTAPGALTSPSAGRVLAKLLVVIAIEGGNDLITPYLVPIPGQDANFEVRAYRTGNLEPTDVRPSADAVAALRIAIRMAREGDVGVEVLSRSPGGLERCVFVRDSTGEFEFRHPGSDSLTGDRDGCRLAEQLWDATMTAWRAWVAAEHPLPLGPGPAPEEWASPKPAEAAATKGGWITGGAEVPSQWPHDWGTGAPDPLFQQPGDWAGQAVTPLDPTSSFDVRRVSEDPVQTELSSPGDRTRSTWAPRPDDGEPEADQREPATGAAAPTAPAPPLFGSMAGNRPPSRSAETDILIDAIQQGFANLVVPVDIAQIDRSIRAALDSQRRDLAEGLARRVSTLVGQALAVPDADELAASVAPLVPRPGDVADLVTARIGALLSETVLRRPSDTTAQVAMPPGMTAAVERLQLQLDDLRDQVRRSTGVIDGFSDQLDASERRATVVHTFTVSLEREMQRLAHSVDEQVEKLAANAGGGSELSDGVARLTRKLRQSVAQLDRALVRLNDVLDQTEAG